MLVFEESEDTCLVCNSHESHRQKMKINRTFREENIVSFTICDDCLLGMGIDISEYMYDYNVEITIQ